MRKELFEFRHIVKHIGGHAALRDVSLRLYQGGTGQRKIGLIPDDDG